MKNNIASLLLSGSFLLSGFSYGAPKIILKLDDLSVSKGICPCRPTLDYLMQQQVKAGFGAIADRLDSTALETLSPYLKATNAKGEKLFEIWNHGLDHVKTEFKGTGYQFQKEHFALADQRIKSLLGIQMHSFGTPYNASDSVTNRVISEFPEYKGFMFSSVVPSSTKQLMYLDNRVNMENGTGNPNYDFFAANYAKFKNKYTDYMTLQVHPNNLTPEKMDQFKQIIQFLKKQGCEFVLPEEYYASHSPAVSAKKKAAENQIFVSDLKELKSAISKAKPGQILVMKDGEWHDAVIDFDSKASSSAPVTLRAQTPGKVILDGNSKLTFLSPHLVADGLFFKNGALEGGSVITCNSDSCRLTNTAIQDYNPPEVSTGYYWVLFRGNYNRMDHCFFTGKSNMNPVVQNDNENARFNRVDSCIVKDIPYIPNANGREIFRIFGYGHADETGDDGAYFTLEYNLFDHAHGEGTEIVSLKSNYNVVRCNTVIASRGGLVGRRGKFNTLEGNFILGENQEGTTGIRVAGANHRVINNYIADMKDDGLRLIAGEYYTKRLTSHFAPKKKDLPKYLQVQNGYFAHNTIINCGGHGIDIGYNYKDNWPVLQMVLLPENNRFLNNLVYKCKGNSIHMAVQDNESPLDIFLFKPNYSEGNVVWGGNADTTILSAGTELIDPVLKSDSDGIYRPDKNSPVIDTGFDTDVQTDMDGQIRDDKKDVGADERTNGYKTHHPLSSKEVGPQWMK